MDAKLSDQEGSSGCEDDRTELNQNLDAPVEQAANLPLKDLLITHPQQTTHQFANGITISSEFDSGNLYNCKQSEDNDHYFELYMSGDGLPYTKFGHYYSWFYFSVKGAKSNEDYTFSIRNMGFQSKLYRMGLRPVYRIHPHSMKWKRCTGSIRWDMDEKGQNFLVTWTHNFSNYNPETDTFYFAWTYPYSFEESLKKSQKWMAKLRRQQNIYVHREVICYSREKRPMEMLTITGKTKQTDQREALIEGLFQEANGDPDQRPFIFDKPTIFISSRVHPGETPASFVLDGIMKFLMKQSEQAKILLEKFTFKIVPILNPDGVYRGYWRLDTLAQNLNRFYINPDPVTQPTIYGVKKVIVQQIEQKKLEIYVDLHAHASKRGCFMFGNSLKGEDHLKNMLLPKLVSLNSLNFDFLECSFSDQLMNCRDKKDGLTREGCGRVSIMQAANGLPNCYTLECNYASGRRINHLSQKLNIETGAIEPELPITDAKNRFYTEHNGKDNKKSAPTYTIEVFEDVGRAFCIGLLDFFECNPVSRLPLSIYKNIEGVKQDLLAKNSIFIAKKKEESKQVSQPQARQKTRGGLGRQESQQNQKPLQQVASTTIQKQQRISATVTSNSVSTKTTTAVPSAQSLNLSVVGKKNLQKVGSALVHRNTNVQRKDLNQEQAENTNKTSAKQKEENLIDKKQQTLSFRPKQNQQTTLRTQIPRNKSYIQFAGEKIIQEEQLKTSNQVQSPDLQESMSKPRLPSAGPIKSPFRVQSQVTNPDLNTDPSLIPPLYNSTKDQDLRQSKSNSQQKVAALFGLHELERRSIMRMQDLKQSLSGNQKNSRKNYLTGVSITEIAKMKNEGYQVDVDIPINQQQPQNFNNINDKAVNGWDLAQQQQKIGDQLYEYNIPLAHMTNVAQSSVSYANPTEIQQEQKLLPTQMVPKSMLDKQITFDQIVKDLLKRLPLDIEETNAELVFNKHSESNSRKDSTSNNHILMHNKVMRMVGSGGATESKQHNFLQNNQQKPDSSALEFRVTQKQPKQRSAIPQQQFQMPTPKMNSVKQPQHQPRETLQPPNQSQQYAPKWSAKPREGQTQQTVMQGFSHHFNMNDDFTSSRQQAVNYMLNQQKLNQEKQLQMMGGIASATTQSASGTFSLFGQGESNQNNLQIRRMKQQPFNNGAGEFQEGNIMHSLIQSKSFGVKSQISQKTGEKVFLMNQS